MRRLARTLGILGALAAIAALIERFVFASPRHRGPKTDHFDGLRFRNASPGWQSEGSFLKWRLTRKPGAWPDWIDEPPGPPPPSRVGGARMRVTFVNHATLLVQTAGLNILTDPIWSERCSPVQFAGPKRHRAPGIRFEDLPPIDIVLVSHNHYDHMDIPTLRRLAARGTTTRIITPLNHAAVLRRHGLTAVSELDWWEEMPIGDAVRIAVVPAQHFSARAISDRNYSLWGGFVIRTPAGGVFFAGDTGWGPHFEEIGRRYEPVRLALLPIGAYLPRWFMKPAHITPAEAVDAHDALRARTTVVMHYGTFALGDDGEVDPVRDLRAALARRPERNVLILRHGEGTDVP